MAQNVSELYDGSRVLTPVSLVIGLPVDQVNFLACQFLALLLGFPYRTIFGPHRASPGTRHALQVIIGMSIAYFCFGRQIIHIFAQSVICIALMRILKPGLMEKTVLMFSMSYLCCYHIYRLYLDYGGYTLDISGPLMLLTQRLSSLAFNLGDGLEKNEAKLTPMMKRLAIKEMPNSLELASYVFCFHQLMCSPFCFYKDYLSFIEGTNYYHAVANNNMTMVSSSTTLADGSVQTGNNNVNHSNHRCPPPAPGFILVQKVLTSLLFGLSVIYVHPLFPPFLLTGPQFAEYSFIYKNFLVWFLTFLQRQQYYFAWKLSEAVNVSCGLGYNGRDEQGREKWDLVDNANILKIEFSTSQKQLLDSWNKTTIYWLRYVVYERFHSSMAVFMFSAFWHGFYGGYYLTFLSSGLLLNTAKMARRRFRPFFQTTPSRAFAYNVLTFFVTHVSMSYVGFPFMILSLTHCLNIYWNLYFWQHLLTVALMLVLYTIPVPQHAKTH